MTTKGIVLVFVSLLFALAPAHAFAYVGPGSGMTVIGGALAFVAGIVLAIIGFVWYPVKRLLRYFSRRSKAQNSASHVTR